MSTTKSRPLETQKNILKSSSWISLGVLSSRVLGFLRDVILANLLGTGIIAEAFFVAQRIPNLLRDLVGEGAANAAIVPVLSEYQKTKSKDQWLKLINVLLAWGAIILTVVTILGILLAPWIIRLIAPGFLGDAKLFNLTVDLTRIMFPFLILIGLTALQMGVLYTLNSYKAPAFSSCLLNIALILSSWIALYFSWAVAYILAAGVLVGGICQLLWQKRALAQLGIVWQWPKRLYHEGIVKIAKLMGPRLWGSAVYQINIFVDTLCASLAVIVGPGGIAAIYFANRLIQFPLGVFAYALSNAALPSLSGMSSQGDNQAFKETILYSLKNLLFVLLPCAVYLIMMAPDIVKTIFQHGAFDEYSASITITTLQFLCLGMPFYGAVRILVSGFYAMQDTRTSVVIATYCLVLNVILNIVLMYPLKIGGIALASSISGIANFILLYYSLRERIGSHQGELIKFIFRVGPALLMMGACMYLSLVFLKASGVVKIITIGLIGFMTYLICCVFMRVAEVRPLWKKIKNIYRKSLKASP